ncbi:hypothetical protein LTR95_017736, partial [Oleoguttula sp. CCFEE 5521]
MARKSLGEADQSGAHPSPAVSRQGDRAKPRNKKALANVEDTREGHLRKASISQQISDPPNHAGAESESMERSTSTSCTSSTASTEDSDITEHIEKGGGGMETYAAFKSA